MTSARRSAVRMRLLPRQRRRRHPLPPRLPPLRRPAAPPPKPAPAAAPAAPAAVGSAVFPSAVDAKYSKESAGKARMATCLDQYKANKASNANGGLKWIQKGGGYYSE